MSQTLSPCSRYATAATRLLFIVATLSLFAACSGGPTAEEYYQRATAFHDSGDLRAATIELKNALRKNPEMGKARGLLGRIYVTLGFGAPAEKELARAAQIGPITSTLRLALLDAMRLQGKFREILQQISTATGLIGAANVEAYRGMAEAGLGHYSQAQKSYQRAIERNSGNVVAQHGLARLLLYRGRLDAARKQLDFSLQANPGDLEALLMDGDYWIKKVNYLRAENVFRRALTISETHSKNLTRDKRRALLALARILLAQHKPEAAKPHLMVIKKVFPLSHTVNHLLAVASLQRGDLDNARKYSQDALSIAPDEPNSLLLLGGLELRAGNTNSAREHARRLVANYKDSIPGRKLLAAVDIKLGESQKAIKLMLPIISKGTQDSAIYALLGSAYFAARDYSRATSNFQQAARLDKSNAGGLDALTRGKLQTQLALSYLAAGDSKKAVPILNAASNLDSSYVGADYLLAMLYLNKRAPVKARQSAQRLATKQPENPVPYNIIGTSYRIQGSISKAKSAYLKALTIAPGYVTAAMNLGQLELDQGHTEEARKRYQQVLDKHPENPDALVAMARLSLREDKSTDAVRQLIQARKSDPSALEPRLLLAAHYLRLHQWEKASTVATEAYRIAPKNPLVVMTLAMSQLSGDHAKEALTNLHALEKLNPKNPGASYFVALAQAQLGDLAGARAALQRTLQIKPDHLLANAALGRLEIRVGHPELALPIARRLIKSHPKSSAGYVLQGETLSAQKDVKGAAASFAVAFNRSPTSLLAQRLFQARRAAGNSARAERGLRVWLNKHPNDVDAYLLLGYAASQDGRDGDAVRAYETAVGIAPNNALALNNLADLYDRAKDPRALATAKRAYESRPELADVLDTYGWILAQGNSAEKGLELLRKAAAKMPENLSVHYHLAAALAKLGNTKEARFELRRLLDENREFPEKIQASTLLQQLQLLQ